MPIGKILYGVSSSGATPHYENELLLGYPPYDWVTDRALREGSEFAQAPSGAEDAWITGRDYTFEGEFRFIPDKPSTSPERSVVAGPQSWQAFLDYCRDKNDFRFAPFSTIPDFYVEKCYLVEPIRGFGANLADLSRGVRLVMRTTSMDFTQAMRGIMLEYKPGAHLNEVSTGASYARGSTANFIGSPSSAAQGQLVKGAASGIIRDAVRTSSSERMTLLEHASTNTIIRSAQLDSTAWQHSTGLIATANYRTAPDGTTTADRLVVSTSAGAHRVAQSSESNGLTLPMTTGQVLSAIGHFLGDQVTWVEFTVESTAGAHTGALIDLASTGRTASSVAASGGVIAIAPVFRELNDNWVEVQFAGNFNSSSTAYRVSVRAFGPAASCSFTPATTNEGFYAWGIHVEAASTNGAGYTPTSYIATSSASATRSADALSFHWPWKPQASWVYTKWQERGSINMADRRLWVIGTTAYAGPYFCAQLSTTNRRAIYSGTTDPATFAAASAASSGNLYDIHELLVTLSSAGQIRCYTSINGGTEVTGAASTSSIALPGAWAATTKLVLNEGNGVNAGAEGFMHVKAGVGNVASIAAARSA